MIAQGLDKLTYQTGFGNHFSSEAIPGTLPVGQNSPQECAFGLYAEQLSGSAFTAPRKDNLRTWLYRRHPSVGHGPFEAVPRPDLRPPDDTNSEVTPDQLRWRPDEASGSGLDFVQGLRPMCGSGSPLQKSGYQIYTYAFTEAMEDFCFCNADGDFLLVVQQGPLLIVTELGLLHVAPCEVCVLPRGMRFAVGSTDGALARGYVLEVFEGHFTLPDLGLIGANGLANPRDFEVPVAHPCSERQQHQGHRLIQKLGGRLFAAQQQWSPFDVVAWHGNYVPYKYDLRKFCPMNTVRVDHADPSIFTVLTCPSAVPGTAVADLVVFPPRWSVAENTFRPPYFHRNVMNEYMGLICGAYEAKATFKPGGSSLHVCMSPHGPDLTSYNAATAIDTRAPQRLPSSTMAFMFEVNHTPRVMRSALQSPHLDQEYRQCWQGFPVAKAFGGKATSDAKAIDQPAENGTGALPGGQAQKEEVKAETISSTG
ncbi:hypothetical protein WJX73_000948 [Symbiochloris irregularis]|uniref:homogentisate 1,2-dioxygenase n=1 Tax=Symbiochloris irregularis TaxID=706552 RepID=A0AAW1NYH5_9CHLO